MIRMAQLVRAAPPAPALPAAGPLERVLGNPLEAFETLEAFIARLQAFATATAVAPGVPFPWTDLERLMGQAVAMLEQSNDLFWLATRRPAPADVDYLAFHHARVAVMAVRVGTNLGYRRPELLALGLAACLFDFGLLGVPEATLRAAESASPETEGSYRDHPRRAAALIRGWTPPYPSIAEAVLHHHEREHGQGYPQGLTAEAIHPHATILGLVDLYTRLTVPPTWQPPQAPHEAVRQIVRHRHDAFPTDIIKALLKEVSVFPPGTMVRLNTGETGRVVHVNRQQPLRPRVSVVVDAKGHALSRPREVDLGDTPFLFITGATGGAR